MLKQARGSTDRLAWLLSEGERKALRIRQRAARRGSAGLCFYAPDFALTEAEPWFLGEAADYPLEEPLVLPELLHKAEPSSADFARLFEEISARIRAGEFEKVVPMVCEELEFAEKLDRRMFRMPVTAGQFAYGFQFGDEGLAGVTPEILFSVEDGTLSTMALAGTGRADGPSLLQDHKELHEHRLVIDHIVSELREWGEEEVGATEEKTFGTLKHLRTRIRIGLDREPNFEALVARLHPTAALGGWPRKPAVDWLERQNFHSTRGRFGAPFGFVDGERMLCVVAIRGVQWTNARLQISAGCGIVGESQVLSEWRELELKRQAIYRTLGVEL